MALSRGGRQVSETKTVASSACRGPRTRAAPRRACPPSRRSRRRWSRPDPCARTDPSTTSSLSRIDIRAFCRPSVRDTMRYQTYPKRRSQWCWHSTESARRFARAARRVKNARNRESNCPPGDNVPYGADGNDWRNIGGIAVGGDRRHRRGSARRCGRGHGVGSGFPPQSPGNPQGRRPAVDEHAVSGRQVAAQALRHRRPTPGMPFRRVRPVERPAAEPGNVAGQLPILSHVGLPRACAPGTVRDTSTALVIREHLRAAPSTPNETEARQ